MEEQSRRPIEAKHSETMAVGVMVGTVTVSGRKPSRHARTLQAAMRAAGLGTQYGSSQFLF
jgi:hypothetical protein